MPGSRTGCFDRHARGHHVGRERVRLAKRLELVADVERGDANDGSRAHDGERDGLMLVTQSKYGFSARSGELAVSLVRSARITGCDDHRYAAPRGLGRLKLASPFSDQGRHEIRLALGHYDLGAPREHQPAAIVRPRDSFTLWLAERNDVARARRHGVIDPASVRIRREDVDLCVRAHRQVPAIR